jgi:hypothetical protein
VDKRDAVHGTGFQNAQFPSFSVIAPSGHTAMHPPQLWQSSGKVSTVSPRTAMARNRHISAHFLHWLHFSRSISGTGVVTVLFLRWWPQKQMGIGLFHVTVQQLNRAVCGYRKIGGNGGFSGAAFPAGDADNHSMMPP